MRLLPSIRLLPRTRELEPIIIITSHRCVSESVSESASESDAESASTTPANFSVSSSSSLSSSLLCSKRHEPGLRALKNVGRFARNHALVPSSYATKTHPALWVRDGASPIDSMTLGHQNVSDAVPPPRSAYSESHDTSARHPPMAYTIAGSAEFRALETRRARGRAWMSATSFQSSSALERRAALRPWDHDKARLCDPEGG